MPETTPEAISTRTKVSFVVPGRPVPQGRPRFISGHAYLTNRDREYRNKVAGTARLAMLGQPPMTGQIKLNLQFQLQQPVAKVSRWKKKAYAEKQLRPTKRPDIDNLIKAIADALNGIAYGDDAQVVVLMAEKVFSATPCAVVEVERIGGLPKEYRQELLDRLGKVKPYLSTAKEDCKRLSVIKIATQYAADFCRKAEEAEAEAADSFERAQYELANGDIGSAVALFEATADADALAASYRDCAAAFQIGYAAQLEDRRDEWRQVLKDRLNVSDQAVRTLLKHRDRLRREDARRYAAELLPLLRKVQTAETIITMLEDVMRKDGGLQ